MLKIGSQLINEELVQLAQYNPMAPMGSPTLALFISGQVSMYSGLDVPEAWTILQPETGFVQVGSDGLTLVNTNLVELAFIVPGPPQQFVFRIQGRDYMFDAPGKFDFSALQTPMAAAETVDTDTDSDNAQSQEERPSPEWADVKKNAR